MIHEALEVVVGDALLAGGGVGAVGMPQTDLRLRYPLQRWMELGLELRFLPSSR